MKKTLTFILLLAALSVLAACSAFADPASAAAPEAAATAAPTAKPSGPYTLEEAELLVYERLPGATIVRFFEDYDDGRLIFEGEATDEEYVYEFEIDAQTGRFREWDMERIRRRAEATAAPAAVTASAADDGLIGTARAQEIALEKAGEGAQIRRIKLDRDDGRQVYEGEAYVGRIEYDFEIDALTGVILEWDRDD